MQRARYFIDVGEERIELRHYRVEIRREVRQLVEKLAEVRQKLWQRGDQCRQWCARAERLERESTILTSRAVPSAR